MLSFFLPLGLQSGGFQFGLPLLELLCLDEFQGVGLWLLIWLVPPGQIPNNKRIDPHLLLGLYEGQYHFLETFWLIGTFEPLPKLLIPACAHPAIEPILLRIRALTAWRPTHNPTSQHPQLETIQPLRVKPLPEGHLWAHEFFADEGVAQFVAVGQWAHVHDVDEAGRQGRVDQNVVGV